MNIYLRALIVLLNLLVFVLLFLPAFLWVTLCHIYSKIRYDLDITYKEMVGYYIEGVYEGMQNNAKFMRDGDITIFRL